jgi:mono/diheme cytochrome c family protein
VAHPAKLAIVAIAALCAACGTARRDEPLYGALRLDRAEQHGQRVFFEYCNQCHPQGEAGLGPAINNKPLPNVAIRLQVRRGIGYMPAFDESVIPDRDLDRLLAYLEALREHGDELR